MFQSMHELPTATTKHRLIINTTIHRNTHIEHYDHTTHIPEDLTQQHPSA